MRRKRQSKYKFEKFDEFDRSDVYGEGLENQNQYTHKGGSKKRANYDPLTVALRFIKFRARSQWEVENRLRREGFSEDVISQTIEKLKEKGFIDDEKFAYLYAYDSLVIHYKGPFRIRYELRQLHVDEYIIEDAIKKVLEEVDIQEIIEKLTKGLDEHKKREKLYRNGFGGDW
ncbi:regulatory protein [Fervidobacterium changbaicum]|uniref:Regulatory protein RecX n=2 Tax=Fervidobacterium TaxID=2422 RepID=A0AAI8GDN7_FERIS|nr:MULTISPECIES: regulatory protein RecX [Fervidobacterium]AMW33212.1 RecX family transcriptional regulator [Fervidobacterium islandicum]QAV33272.1 RecX family transcriptional regulator [Fervidobacterium changbaicum]SDH06873.1 regulatory protein [Fervidobacterium changbaicum]